MRGDPHAGVSPLDVSCAMPVATAAQFDAWLRPHGTTEREVIVAIFEKASGKQTVSFDALLEMARCHGWVDTPTNGIDGERYAIRVVRSVPRGDAAKPRVLATAMPLPITEQALRQVPLVRGRHLVVQRLDSR
jgi:hypothetical protein